MTCDPIIKTIRVALDCDAAFDLFTSDMSTWWPRGRHSVSAGQGETARSVTIEGKVGGKIVEVMHTGETTDWGTVQVWEKGRAFATTWHPGQGADAQTHLNVAFKEDGDGCVVTLTHSGWDALEDGATKRSGYNSGWDGVLAAYSSAAS